MAEYRRPFPTPQSRLPTLQWPREIPIAGEPAHVVEVIERYWAWFSQSDLPKLLIHVEPGALMPPEAVAWHQENLQNLTTAHAGPGLHFLQEDQPQAVGEALRAWLANL